MNSLRKLSLNDLYRLCTNFKVAKSGYYPIRVDNKSTESGSRAEPLPSGGGSGSNAQLSQHAPGSKIKIDGSFEDWKDYKVGWRESEGNKTDDIGDDIKLIDLFYCNDATCLYLFFRCKPTVQERYEKLQSGQMLGYLYVDSDSDRTTGATEIDASGDSRTLGADIQIPLRAGVFAYTSAEGTRKGCSVSYEVNRWDPATKAFSIRERDQDSIHGGLIAHGKDGVEMALLLPDLKKVKSNEFDFIYLEWSINTKGPARRIRMRID
jgi:hypothetical protein